MSAVETREGPLMQSISIGFIALQVATALLAIAWALGNVVTVRPGEQAVAVRFGAVTRMLPPGLAVAWPAPFERVVTLPGPDRQISLSVVANPGGTPSPDAMSSEDAAPPQDPHLGTFLTADGEVVLLDATLTWRISDASAYFVAQDHVAAALRRLYLRVAIAEAATHPLDDFLAVRPERAHDPVAADARAAVRIELARAINAGLAELAAQGTPLGVAVTRVDLAVQLPPEAKASFDAVLDAAQRADETIAAARTDAVRVRQGADRERDRVLAVASASASERVDAARLQTATISALAAKAATTDRPALLLDLYRERIAAVLHQAASVSTVGADSGRVLLPEARDQIR